jgi:hypothetical protein
LEVSQKWVSPLEKLLSLGNFVKMESSLKNVIWQMAESQENMRIRYNGALMIGALSKKVNLDNYPKICKTMRDLCSDFNSEIRILMAE